MINKINKRINWYYKQFFVVVVLDEEMRRCESENSGSRDETNKLGVPAK